jgi:hypothetical protein
MSSHHTISDLVTGSAPPGFAERRDVTNRDLVLSWFVAPLAGMKGDDAFVCLMLCFPLIEAVIRLEYSIPDQEDVPFSHQSPALHWFAKFMSIPESQARVTWDGLRNGLLHRAMIKAEFDYELSPKMSGRNADFADGRIIIFVWELRDSVVGLVRRHHTRLWKGSSSPLPGVYVNR